jgi:predicted transcriptional regulator
MGRFRRIPLKNSGIAFEEVRSAAELGSGQPQSPAQEKLIPLMPIKKTVTPDHLISLEDGRPYKSLKRHPSGRGLTPEQYRQKWGLPTDYPMVASNYAAGRSELAKAAGLGRQRKKQPAAAPAKEARPRRKAA